MIQNALPLLVLAAAAGLFVAAAVSDFQRFIIPNLYNLVLLLLFAAFVFVAPLEQAGLIYERFDMDQLLAEDSARPELFSWEASRWLGHLMVGGVVFVITTVCFAFGFFGGGDAKLFTVAALWAGPKYLTALIVITGAAGGLLALAMLLTAMAARKKLAASATVGSATLSDSQEETSLRKTPVPYGIAIALAALYVIYRTAEPLL
ncbi:prepilin peptidase [Rhodovibrionaceae bacterium A322]